MVDGYKCLVDGYKCLVDGYKCLVDGYKCLVDGYKCLVDGYKCLVDGYKCLVDGYKCLVDGYKCLVEKYGHYLQCSDSEKYWFILEVTHKIYLPHNSSHNELKSLIALKLPSTSLIIITQFIASIKYCTVYYIMFI